MRFHTASGTNPDQPKAMFHIQGPQNEEHVPPEIVSLCKRWPHVTKVMIYHSDLNLGGTTPQTVVYIPIRG